MSLMSERSALEKMTEREKQKVELLRLRFLEWLEAIQFSPKTRVNYAREVKLFLEWLSDNTDVAGVAEVTPQHLQQYQIALYQQSQSEEDGEVKRLAVGTQAAKLAAVKKFCEWLLAEQQIAHNPAGMLQSPRRPRTLPRDVLTQEEARALIESTPTRKPRDIRDRALIEVLYSTGLRRAELIDLQIYDLDLAASTLRIEQGKGHRTRIVPLTSSAMAALRLYLDESRSLWAKAANQTYLFVSTRSGGPLDDADIVRIVRKAAKRAGLAKHVTPHTLRHSCATHLLQGQADIRQIQKLLGHRRLSSTEIYTHVEIGDLQEVISRCHPRERKKTE
jgi:integrase/recombinase XerD